MQLSNEIPEAAQALALSHEQLAHAILSGLDRELRAAGGYHMHANAEPNFNIQSVQADHYGADQRPQIHLAIQEAWAWMTRELILVPSLGNAFGWYNISRIGRTFLQSTDPLIIVSFRFVDQDFLHPGLRGAPIDSFWRGDYDLCVFSAYRAVEVAVRLAGGFQDTLVGKALMIRAFRQDDGPLTDTATPAAEQVSTMELFAGAIGLFKNPNSHRAVQVGAADAAKLLVFASYLLDLIDARRPEPQPDLET